MSLKSKIFSRKKSLPSYFPRPSQQETPTSVITGPESSSHLCRRTTGIASSRSVPTSPVLIARISTNTRTKQSVNSERKDKLGCKQVGVMGEYGRRKRLSQTQAQLPQDAFENKGESQKGKAEDYKHGYKQVDVECHREGYGTSELERKQQVDVEYHREGNGTSVLERKASSFSSPNSDEQFDDCEKELWWRDIHEPMLNIVEMIQKQIRDLELKEDTRKRESSDTGNQFVAFKNNASIMFQDKEENDERKIQEELKQKFVSRCYTL